MTRSQMMAAIKSTGNKSTEIKFRTALSRAGVRGWTIQPDFLQGRPDLAFVTDKVAVFLDGCFWHGCEDHFRAPKTRRGEWLKKVRANKRRDVRNVEALIAEGWKVFRIWEHDLADPVDIKGLALRVARAADTKDQPGLERRALRALAAGLEPMACIPCAAMTGHRTQDLTGFKVYKLATCVDCGTATRRVNGISLNGGGYNGK